MFENLFLPQSLILGYLFGSIPTGYLYAKTKNINILEYGSKNPGSTNIGRALGKKSSHIVFVLDIIKIIIPIFILMLININLFNKATHIYRVAEFIGDSWIHKFHEEENLFILRYKCIVIYTGLGGVIGHCFPLYSKFKNGGRGISCTMGCILCLSPIYAIFLFCVYKIVSKVTKYVSIGSITAVVSLFISSVILMIFNIYPFNFISNGKVLPGIFMICFICILRHKENIKRLINGNESKIE